MIAAAVLAAGASRRLGRPKQLLTFAGEPLLSRAVRAASGAGVDATIVVLGAAADTVRSALSRHQRVVVNEGWEEGIASSIRAAVDWARKNGAEGLLFVLSDQPLVPTRHLGRLVDAWRVGWRAAATSYGAVVGAPAAFDRTWFDALHSLRGDAGAGRLLQDRSDVLRIPCAFGAFDVDTPEDMACLGGGTA